MNVMSRYYVSRALFCIVFGGLFALAGWLWWLAILAGIMPLAIFLWLPHSGRYVVRPELGVTALRRDERTQRIADRAARNAGLVTMLATGAVVIYFGLIAPAQVPVAVLNFVLLLGILVYWVSDFRMRRL